MTKRKPDVIEFDVEGHTAFPLDMLRYDACYPATQDDVWPLGESHFDARTRVTLKHRVLRGENPAGKPERSRWASFGWQVVGDVRWHNVD